MQNNKRYTLTIHRAGEEEEEEAFDTLIEVQERLRELRGQATYDSPTYAYLTDENIDSHIKVL